MFVAAVAAWIVLFVGGNDIRGVSSNDQHQFNGLRLSCGDTSIPLSQVNDDYCDCPDGCDEPGTSACGGLSKYYCDNEGYVGAYIPTSRVHDGICDCCDGSDERVNVCPNTCEQVGKVYREKMAEDTAIRERGLKKKLEYVAQGRSSRMSEEQYNVKRAELATKLEQMDDELATLREEADKLEEHKEEKVRLKENLLVVKRIESLKLSQLSRAELEKLTVNVVVKGGSNSDLVSLVKEILPEEDVSWFTNSDNEEEEEGVDPTFEDEHDSYDEVDDEEETKQAEDTIKEKQETCPIQSRLKKIHTKKSGLDGIRNDLRNTLETLESEFSMDFGPEQEFYTLKGKCFKSKIEQYNYEICPFGKAKQDQISLGDWVPFENNDYKVFKFQHGASCWNGPKRSLTVHLTCGDIDEIFEVWEPETCTYHMKFRTPAACVF